MLRVLSWTAAVALAVLVVASPATLVAAPILFSASGPDSTAIQGTVDAYRAALGNPNNGNAPGPLPDGRREINWDGGGTAVTPGGTPFTAFENIRGATITTPGTGVLQAPPTGPVGGFDTFFSNPSYANIFTTFSSPRLFTAVGSNIMDVFFSIPGTNGATAATVAGFGAVFTDVDLAGITSIQYFDALGASLGTFFVPPSPGDGSQSFLGVLFDAGEQVASVRITTGNAALAQGVNDGGGIDLVALDDFLYSEPQVLSVIPEPASMTLAVFGAGAAGLAAVRRRMRGKADPRTV